MRLPKLVATRKTASYAWCIMDAAIEGTNGKQDRCLALLYDDGAEYMATRQIVLNILEKVLLAEKTDEVSFAQDMRILAAVKLYELGRLSSGRAAELACMPRVEFLLLLGRYKVFPFEAELQELEQLHA